MENKTISLIIFIETIILSIALGFALGHYLHVSADTVTFETNLSYGLKRNPDVVNLQNFLIQEGYFEAQPTGNFYSLTQEALVNFQLDHNISPATGYFGPITRALVNTIEASSTDAQGSLNIATSTLATTTAPLFLPDAPYANSTTTPQVNFYYPAMEIVHYTLPSASLYAQAIETSSSTAELFAVINPNGSDTSCHWVWGTDYTDQADKDFGSNGSLSSILNYASQATDYGSGTANIDITFTLTGLQLHTPTSFAIVCENAAGIHFDPTGSIVLMP